MESITEKQVTDEKFYKKVFDLMRIAIESHMKPMIPRKEAITIINKKSVDYGVKVGKLTPHKHGKQIYFDRIQFYEYCHTSNLNLNTNGRSS